MQTRGCWKPAMGTAEILIPCMYVADQKQKPWHIMTQLEGLVWMVYLNWMHGQALQQSGKPRILTCMTFMTVTYILYNVMCTEHNAPLWQKGYCCYTINKLINISTLSINITSRTFFMSRSSDSLYSTNTLILLTSLSSIFCLWNCSTVHLLFATVVLKWFEMICWSGASSGFHGFVFIYKFFREEHHSTNCITKTA